MVGNSIQSTVKNKWLFTQLNVARLLAKDNFEDGSIQIKSGFYLRCLKYCLASLKLIYFWLRHSISFNKLNISSLDHIFFSSNEGHDIKNYHKHIPPKEYISLDAFSMSSFYKLSSNPSLSRVIKLFLEAINESEAVFQSLDNKPALSNSIYEESLGVIANYVYLVALIEMIKKTKEDIAFYHCGAVLQSAAIIRVGMKSTYLTHGFIGRISNISFPDYKEIYVYSKEEAKHVETITKKNNVIIYPARPIRKHSRKIIIFSRQFDKDMSKEYLQHLIDYFIENGLEVVLKPHPSFMGDVIENISKNRKIRVVEKDKDAEKLILEEQPLFSAAWYSTSLCEALRLRSIPIRLSNKDDNLYSKHNLSEIVYPLFTRTLSWEDELDIIANVLNKNISVDQCLKTLGSR